MKEITLFCFIVNLFIALLCGILLPVVPRLTRKTFLFGVRVPPEAQDDPEARAMKKNYVAACLCGTAAVLALTVTQYILAPRITLLGSLILPLLFIPIQMAAFIPNWKKAGRLKAERGWTVPNAVFADTASSHSRGTLAEMPWGWYAAAGLLVCAGFAAALAVYPSLPDTIVTHYGGSGIPNGWGGKWQVFIVPFVSLLITASMVPVGIMFVRAKLQIDRTDPMLSFAQHTLYRRKMGNAIGALVLSMAAVLTFVGFTMLWPELTAYLWVIHIFYAPPTLWLIVLSVRCGQGGCKLKPKISAETPVPLAAGGTSGRGDDKTWVLGMFYHNPDDPANIVEDRFGGNLGFNYARPAVRTGVAAGLLVLAASYVWLIIRVLSIL
ncbi:MAG: DUF1648 domain-containing protein [Oscillospiraceae bacterium]|jgi:uncharacterized membrane protein|nr:DUF1648 domain-containing protein [Oscillospiraceae bacterium]